MDKLRTKFSVQVCHPHVGHEPLQLRNVHVIDGDGFVGAWIESVEAGGAGADDGTEANGVLRVAGWEPARTGTGGSGVCWGRAGPVVDAAGITGASGGDAASGGVGLLLGLPAGKGAANKVEHRWPSTAK